MVNLRQILRLNVSGESLRKISDSLGIARKWALERVIGDFINYYNNERYHEALNNVTPADVYFGRNKIILQKRDKIKKQTMKQRRKINLKNLHNTNKFTNFKQLFYLIIF